MMYERKTTRQPAAYDPRSPTGFGWRLIAVLPSGNDMLVYWERNRVDIFATYVLGTALGFWIAEATLAALK